MNCHEFERILDAYVDGELGPADAAAVADHVEGCATCRRRLASRESLAAALGAAGIRYRHLEALGGRRDPLKASPNPGLDDPQLRDRREIPERITGLDGRVCFAIHFRVRIDKVVQRSALLLGSQHDIAALR